MKKSPAILSIWNLVGRTINSFLFIAIANLYGTSQHTDWFFFVYAVAYFFIGISYYSTESALVAVWHNLPASEHADLFRAAWHISIYYNLVIFLILEFVGLFLAPIHGIPYPEVITAAFICFILSFQPSLAFFSSFFSSYKQFQQKYIFPVLHLSFRTVGILLFLLFFQNRTIATLALSYLSGEIVRLSILMDKNLIVNLFKESMSAVDVRHFKTVYSHVSWMTIALMGTIINPVIDLAMVGRFGDGSVTLVEYANRLRGIPVLALSGLAVYYLGEWSHQHNRTINKLAWNTVNRVLKNVLFLSVPSVIFLIISEPIWVPLVFFSEKFNAESIFQIQNLLYWYFPGVIFLAENLILSRAALVVKQEKIMAFITIASSVVNVVFNFFLTRKIGIEGIALSTTITDFFSFIALYIVVKRTITKI
ncbi:MAG: lipid II flippase MurJ [Candidatus Electronema sp. VV]